MQLLIDASSPGTVESAARELLETAPLIMRIIRQNMRRHRSGLTVPQFRTLCYASTYEGCSLSAVADFIGLSLPAMSRLVDGLVEKRLMKRRTCDDDRRHVRLTVTAAGQTTITEARQLAQDRLAKVLASMPPEQRGALVTTMQTLRDLFAPEVVDGDDNAISEVEDAERN